MAAEWHGAGRLISTGWWPTMHLPPRATATQAKVVAGCDRLPERATALAQQDGMPLSCSDDCKLTASGVCEAFMVTTNGTHALLPMDMFKQGLYVMHKTPLLRNHASCERTNRQPTNRA